MKNRREGKEVRIGCNGDSCVEKLKNCILFPLSKTKLWIKRATTMVLLWILLGPADDIGGAFGP